MWTSVEHLVEDESHAESKYVSEENFGHSMAGTELIG